jgi:hypothetical protein
MTPLLFSNIEDSFNLPPKKNKSKKIINNKNSGEIKENMKNQDEPYYCKKYGICNDIEPYINDTSSCSPLNVPSYIIPLSDQTKEMYKEVTKVSLDSKITDPFIDLDNSKIKSYIEDEMDIYFDYNEFKEKTIEDPIIDSSKKIKSNIPKKNINLISKSNDENFETRMFEILLLGIIGLLIIFLCEILVNIN